MINKDYRYIELKSGFTHNGPAWISIIEYSRSGSIIYFNGSALKKHSGINGNYYDLETEEEYWVSRPKKDGNDRHHSGKGLVFVDKMVTKEYMDFLGVSILDLRQFIIVNIQMTDKTLFHNLVNESMVSKKHLDLTNKPLDALRIDELGELVEYYEEKEFLCTPNTATRRWKKAKEEAIDELSRREIQ